jgi:predicted nucleic acid-binding protein
MSKTPLKCVIDANVALKLFFVQPQSDMADALFAHLEANAQVRFYVPDFFYAECTSAFVNYVRLAKYPARAAMEDMAELHALSLSVVPTADLVTEALAIALHHRLNGCDACYVALAHQIQAPLITADEKLVKAMAGKYNVEPLANYSIPSS